MSECKHDMTKGYISDFPFIYCHECGATDEEIKLKSELSKAREEFDQLRNDYQELYAWASKQSWKELEEKYGPPWKTKAKGVLDEQ